MTYSALNASVSSHVSSPWKLSLSSWISVLKRTWIETSRDNLMLIAGGVAFYGFLAFVPLIGAVVLTYGIFADTGSIVTTARAVMRIMPPEAAAIILGQLADIISVSASQKGWGLALALSFAVFGATRATSAIMMALNIVYGCDERRSFLKLNATILLLTIGFVAVIIASFVAISTLAIIRSQLAGWSPSLMAFISVAAWLGMILFLTAVVAITYRYGPDHDQPTWQWISPGSLFTTLGGLVSSLLFGVYVSNFAGYNATYGALGAIVALLMWFWLSALLLCFGAELNVELEHASVETLTP